MSSTSMFGLACSSSAQPSQRPGLIFAWYRQPGPRRAGGSARRSWPCWLSVARDLRTRSETSPRWGWSTSRRGESEPAGQHVGQQGVGEVSAAGRLPEQSAGGSSAASWSVADGREDHSSRPVLEWSGSALFCLATAALIRRPASGGGLSACDSSWRSPCRGMATEQVTPPVVVQPGALAGEVE